MPEPMVGRGASWFGGGEYDAQDSTLTVCPEHLRFVPCRSCQPGQEMFSADPADVERTRRFQSGEDETAPASPPSRGGAA